jgi:hypothetical protein
MPKNSRPGLRRVATNLYLWKPPVGQNQARRTSSAAIIAAMLDGRGEVAELLTRQLKARQAARLPSNVSTLSGKHGER